MSYCNEDWLAHQQRRWMRPDAHRWIRHDAHRFAPPAAPDAKSRLSRPGLSEQQDAADVEFRQELNALRREHLHLRRRVAELKFEFTLRRLRRKYSPDQPRVPAGNPDGGQWTSGVGAVGRRGSDAQANTSGGQSTDFSAARRLGTRPHGHHYMSHAYYSKLPLHPETRKVFDEAKTGRLLGQRHTSSKEHDLYNEAVIENFDRFLKLHKIAPEQMTPEQARTFIDEVKRSRDPRIRDFNLKIYRREILYWIRRMPRGSE